VLGEPVLVLGLIQLCIASMEGKADDAHEDAKQGNAYLEDVLTSE
jgi:hypothetical protein